MDPMKPVCDEPNRIIDDEQLLYSDDADRNDRRLTGNHPDFGRAADGRGVCGRGDLYFLSQQPGGSTGESGIVSEARDAEKR